MLRVVLSVKNVVAGVLALPNVVLRRSKAMLEMLRTIVRPIVTISLTLAFIYYANVDQEAAKLVAGPMGITIGFWFLDRTNKREGN